jgi:hypothetical protein
MMRGTHAVEGFAMLLRNDDLMTRHSVQVSDIHGYKLPLLRPNPSPHSHLVPW